MRITQDDLLSLLTTISKPTFISLVAETTPSLRKAPLELKPLKKLTYLNATIGFRYENAVNRQRVREDKEPDFEAVERKWGVREGVLVKHNGKTYLEVKVEKSYKYVYRLDGIEVPKEKIEPFLPLKSNSRQDLEKEIILRDYALDSIREISINSQHFEIQSAPA